MWWTHRPKETCQPAATKAPRLTARRDSNQACKLRLAIERLVDSRRKKPVRHGALAGFTARPKFEHHGPATESNGAYAQGEGVFEDTEDALDPKNGLDPKRPKADNLGLVGIETNPGPSIRCSCGESNYVSGY
jgi:hypothetical protein